MKSTSSIGTRAHLARLCGGIGAAGVLACVVVAVLGLLSPTGGERTAGRGIIAASVAGIVGAVSPTRPAWIGATLGLAVVPAVLLTLSWRLRSARGVELQNDLVAPAILLAIYLVPSLAGLWYRRRKVSRAGLQDRRFLDD